MNRPAASQTAVVLLLLALHATTLSAQGVQTGSLAGRVSGPGGEGLPGVAVSARSTAPQVERTGLTGANGDYSLRGLPPGSYAVRFSLDGMARVESRVEVALGLASRADAVLETAEAGDSIIVTGDARSALGDSQGGLHLAADEIDRLPIERGPDDVALLAPGVDDRTVLDQLSISGGLGYDNLIMVDGIDVGFHIFGNTEGPFGFAEVGLFIEEALAETQVITSGIPAEYGRFTGGVINAVTRSGGDRFEGSLRIDLTNPAWRDETPFEDERGVRRESQSQKLYSATAGGRLGADRLWYFLAAADTSRSDPSLLPRTGLPDRDDFANTRLQLKLTGRLAAGHTGELVAMDNDSRVTGGVTGQEIDPRAIDSYGLPHRNWIARYSGVLEKDRLVEAQFARRDFVTRGLGGSSTRIEDSPFFDYAGGGFYNAPVFDENDPSLDFRDEQLAASLSRFLASDRGSHDVKIGFESFETRQVGGKSDTASGFFFDAVVLTDESGTPILDDQGRLQPIWEPFAADTIRYLTDPEARMVVETRALYVNDLWRLGEHWSFNLGLRYEQAEVTASDAGRIVDVDRVLPRLAATLDPTGDGRYRLSAGWAEYAGRYNTELFKRTSSARNPGFLGYLYVGPPGVGIDFAPAFDLDNYFLFFAEIPQANVAYEAGIATPVSREITLSGAARLGDAGLVELTWVDRDLTDAIEDFIRFEDGRITTDSPLGPLTLDRVVLENSDLARRRYRALQLTGRYRLGERWNVAGHWTHELENDGNFEGEDAFNPAVQSRLGDYAEILPASRYAPDGRLASFQEDRIRIWTDYQLGLGRAGDLGISLLYSYDSPRVYSLVARGTPISEIQAARDPGYALPPFAAPLYFGPRGTGEFESSHTFDLALTWSTRLAERWQPWIKVDVRNLFNDRSLRTFNTSIAADPEGPRDALGIPTGYIEGPLFGEATGPDSYVTPRDLRVSLGVRIGSR